MADEYILRSIAIARLTALEATDSFATIADAKRVLADMDAADVVEVVRCKDCEFSRELTKTEKKIWRDECRACESPEASQDGYMIVFPEHFCSYGRRKEQCD